MQIYKECESNANYFHKTFESTSFFFSTITNIVHVLRA